MLKHCAEVHGCPGVRKRFKCTEGAVSCSQFYCSNSTINFNSNCDGCPGIPLYFCHFPLQVEQPRSFFISRLLSFVSKPQYSPNMCQIWIQGFASCLEQLFSIATQLPCPLCNQPICLEPRGWDGIVRWIPILQSGNLITSSNVYISHPTKSVGCSLPVA